MSAQPGRSRLPVRFFVGFGIVVLLIAGVLSYLADSDPDGLDTVTLHGCTQVAGGELVGSCMAQRADDHALAGGPLSDYTVGGNDALTGLSGIIGVVVTVLVAGGLCWLVRGRRAADGQARAGDDAG